MLPRPQNPGEEGVRACWRDTAQGADVVLEELIDIEDGALTDIEQLIWPICMSRSGTIFNGQVKKFPRATQFGVMCGTELGWCAAAGKAERAG